MKTSVFEFMSSFWKMAEQETFTPSEVALYFFLLDRANSQKWRMPIRCPTETVKAYIGTSKQNVIKARNGLKKRGVIDFTPGTGNGNYPLYVLLRVDANKLSDGLSVQLSDELSLYKNKDEEDISNNTREMEPCIEEIENRLLTDEDWQRDVISLMSSKGLTDIHREDINTQLRQFFLYLKTSGVEKREEKECRKHFVNWLSKKLNNKKNLSNEHRSYTENQSARSEAGSLAKSSYHDPF